MYIVLYIYIYIYIYICTHTHTHVCVCINIHTHTQTHAPQGSNRRRVGAPTGLWQVRALPKDFSGSRTLNPKGVQGLGLRVWLLGFGVLGFRV